ncbi:MAG: hypothetical protein U0V87_02420 [Acidobacteriota bacterium]
MGRLREMVREGQAIAGDEFASSDDLVVAMRGGDASQPIASTIACEDADRREARVGPRARRSRADRRAWSQWSKPLRRGVVTIGVRRDPVAAMAGESDRREELAGGATVGVVIGDDMLAEADRKECSSRESLEAGDSF